MEGGRGWTDDSDRPGEPEPFVRRAEPGLFGEDNDTTLAPRAPAGERPGRLELSSVGVLLTSLALLPLSFATLFPLWLILDVPLDLPPYPLCFVVYVALGATTFFRPVQRVLLAVLFGAREPTPSERHNLQPAWDTVRAQADVPGHWYLLTVVDSHAVTAAPTGGAVVTVTTMAVNTLSRDELAGVLAHELGHHYGTTNIALPFAHWLVTPVVVLGELGQRITRLGCLGALACVALVFVGFSAFNVPLALGLAAAGLVLLVVGQVAEGIGRMVGENSEYAADRVAVDLGFGSPLAAALEQHSRLGPQVGEEDTVGQRIFGQPPPAMRRLGRLNARIARQSRG